MYDLVIIHSKDTVSWSDYIRGYLGNEAFNMKIVDRRDTDLLQHGKDSAIQSEVSDAKAIIVIASPLHLQFLVEFPHFNYAPFVTDITKAQLFLCGVTISDFNDTDCTGVSIHRRFPNFSNWKKLPHDRHVDLLRNAMVLMESEDVEKSGTRTASGTKRRRKKEFDVTPLHVNFKESTVVTILFNEPMTENDEQLPLIVAFRVAGKTVKISANWRNPYVYQFTAPDLPPGTHDFAIRANGNEIGSKQLVYGADEPLWATCAQVFVDQMAGLCRFICKKGLMTTEVDDLLTDILDASGSASTTSQALDHFFGVAAHHCAADRGASEFPTLLHLAANFGFHEFASKLIEYPNAPAAYAVRNAEGKIPETMAMDNSYRELALLFQDFRVINETIDNAYEIFLPESSRVNCPSDSSDNSRTPTAVFSSSGSDDIYMTMRGSTKKTPEDSDSETGYVDVETELQELKCRNQQKSEESASSSTEQKSDSPSDQQHNAFAPPLDSDATAETEEDSVEFENDDSGLSRLECVPECQKEIIEIINFAKQGKVTIFEAEQMVKGWKLRHGTGRTKSFRDKQHHLSKLREQLSKQQESAAIEMSCWESMIGLKTTSSPSSSSVNVSIPSGIDRLPSVSPPTTTSRRTTAAAAAQHFSSTDSTFAKTGSESSPLEARAKHQQQQQPQCKKSPQSDAQPATVQPMEPVHEDAQRHSNISGSSRESVLSVNSRASTSSGVDLDAADDDMQSDFDSRQPTSSRRGPEYMGSGTRHLSNKRKSKNLERLEEELTCLEARAPPPLPPRAILSKQSSLLTSPTVLPQRSLPVAVSLPPLPARGGDTLCLKTPSSEEVAPEYFFPPGRCLPQQQQQPPPPIGSPTASARKKTGDSMTRRPLPPEPANPSVGADQSRQVYTQVTRKTETATRRSPGASRKAPGGGESVATRGEPKPSPPPPPPVRLLPGETTAAARELSETASSAVPPKSPAGKTAAATAAAPSKLRSCESFGACEFRQAQRNPDARGGAQVRRIQTTPRLNLEEGEAKKSRIQLQAQLVDDCLRRSLTKGETTACDDAGKVRIRPALPVLIAAKAQEGPTTTCTLLMKYEDPLSPGTPAQTGHELRPAYAPATSSSCEGLQKPDVNADRARDPGGVRAEHGPAKGPEKVMASSSDCNRGLRAQLMSELRSNQLGPECVGSSQEPANKEQRQNPPTSDNVVEKTRAKMEDFDTTPAATAAAAAAAARCFEELWWSEELGAKPDTPEMFRSEAATRSFKKDRKKDEGNSILRIEQQLKSLFSEDCSDSFSTPPTARDSGKPLTVPQTGDAKPEVAAAMATCDRKQSYDVTYCKDPCRRIPIPRLPTCPRLPSFEENTDAVRAARSGQSAQSSCQLTTEQFASGISQERRDIGSDHKSERKSSKCTTRSPQMSSRRPSREADD